MKPRAHRASTASRARRPVDWRSWALKSVLAAGLLGFLGWAERPALGDFMRLEPTTDIDAMKIGKIPFSFERLDRDDERLALAARIDPSNPEVPEYQAQIALIRARVARLDPLQSAGYLVLALKDYRHALTLRPNSGYLWAGRMTTAVALLQVDPSADPALRTEALESLRRAVTLAPWEDTVLREVVAAGSALGAASMTPAQHDAWEQARRHLAQHGMAQ